jgi:hypothetical protein
MRILNVRALVAVGLLAWLSIVGAGFSKLWRYAYTPGIAATPPSDWPSRSLERDRARPTLVMVLHPECGCSQASLEELSRLMARAPSRLSAVVLFDLPAGERAMSSTNFLWRAATAIPGVRARVDSGGQEAARFGARVSGQTFLYDAQGHLRFSGGMTSARGHAGDNDGTAALLAFIATGSAPVTGAPVFGCLLAGESQS